jgi:hypothetical protein
LCNVDKKLLESTLLFKAIQGPEPTQEEDHQNISLTPPLWILGEIREYFLVIDGWTVTVHRLEPETH